MPSAKSRCDKEIKLALLDSIWKQIGAYLESERQRIYEEIKTYPRPIPACDLQFNHLLEKRARIGQELERMHEAARERLGAGNSVDRLAEFIRSSNYIGTEMKEKITFALEEGLSEVEAKLGGR